MFVLAPVTKPAELHPARALLTPTWIGALAVLVANDHWLKGADMIPGALTGKLSDFAGMLVAPVLLAALLRVRSRGALLACHLAVAAVFAGIQLSAGFAAQWSALMGLVGHPWAITCDPTDLIALPFLLLSWKLLVPEMDPSLPTLAPIQRSAVAGLSVFGLWSTVATSDERGIDPSDEWYEDVYGHLYVNNANEFEISLHVRPLRSDVLLDCDQVSSDPGRLLGEDAFGEAEHWSLPGFTNFAIELDESRGCDAAWIAGEGVEPTIVFVDDLALHAPRWWSGQTFDVEELEDGGLGVRFEDGVGGEWIGSDALRFTPKTDAPEQPDSCEIPSGESRLDWPLIVPKRDVRVLGVEAGADGCYELELQEQVTTNSEVTDFGEPYGFYLCAPEAGMPLAEDEALRFEVIYGNSGERELRVTLLDPATLDVAVSESGMPTRQVRYLRGGNDPQFIGPALNRQLVAVPGVSCPWQVEAACATVERHVELAVAGSPSFLQPGVPVSFADPPESGAMVRTAIRSYARERAVLDQSCAEGALQMTYDIDFVVISEPLI
ncbi:hypothetical protein ENSA5_20590 [Enhygromyxa salina]|uniref:Uncharacterized protein n=1 Tax=Enhygromyxa salina TaxID=215803 RepID=A0A2S9YCW0_9BACT|nr:hypothetical protein [Enhygromyxa salina]PRQ02882.1 hypothetical protein ENSA5_20590 [Enhygromyxa salina]